MLNFLLAKQTGSSIPSATVEINNMSTEIFFKGFFFGVLTCVILIAGTWAIKKFLKWISTPPNEKSDE